MGVRSSVAAIAAGGVAAYFLDPDNGRRRRHVVESQIFRGADAPKDAVNVNVEAGVVHLRGQVRSREEIEGLVEAARSVDGVGGVRSLLHLPGEEPPMKEAVPSTTA